VPLRRPDDCAKTPRELAIITNAAIAILNE
jgi:hypothetical protein